MAHVMAVTDIAAGKSIDVRDHGAGAKQIADVCSLTSLASSYIIEIEIGAIRMHGNHCAARCPLSTCGASELHLLRAPSSLALNVASCA
jgi:hypothetical protein